VYSGRRAAAGNVALNRQDSLTGTGSGILNTMQPSLDQLIQITRTLAHDDDFVRDVQGDVQFIEVSDGPEFRTEGKAISQSAGTAGNALYLGLSELE